MKRELPKMRTPTQEREWQRNSGGGRGEADQREGPARATRKGGRQRPPHADLWTLCGWPVRMGFFLPASTRFISANCGTFLNSQNRGAAPRPPRNGSNGAGAQHSSNRHRESPVTCKANGTRAKADNNPTGAKGANRITKSGHK
jgi:hypothetical protein